MAANTASATTSDEDEDDNKYNITTSVYISQEVIDFSDSFYAALSKFYDSQKDSVKKPWTNEKICKVIGLIQSGKVSKEAGIKRTNAEYYWSSRYDTINIAGRDCLTLKEKSSDSSSVRVVPLEEYYDMLLDVHVSIGHGGREKILQKLKGRFSIARKAVDLFVALCPVCESKRNMKKTTATIPSIPLTSKEFVEHGQVDFIDLQSVPDGQYMWLLNYQEDTTKFVHLAPLCSINPNEVASELLKIFLQFGAPNVLQSGRGREFTAEIIEEIVKMWPGCKVINGTPSQLLTHSVERSNQDILHMLQGWMLDNNSTNWATGCYFVQYSRNTSFNSMLGTSPFQVLFGNEPKFSV